MKIDDEKLSEWRLLLSERKKRQIMIKTFCQEKNITPSQFYYYQKMLKKIDDSKGLVRLSNDKEKVIKPIQIVNSTIKEPAAIRFILPNNLQCVLPRDMSGQEIKSILELMMSC